jgi:hypothetical protein
MARQRSFWKDASLPFYGYNRPGAKAPHGLTQGPSERRSTRVHQTQESAEGCISQTDARNYEPRCELSSGRRCRFDRRLIMPERKANPVDSRGALDRLLSF